jgi:hypothetical protein
MEKLVQNIRIQEGLIFSFFLFTVQQRNNKVYKGDIQIGNTWQRQEKLWHIEALRDHIQEYLNTGS